MPFADVGGFRLHYLLEGDPSKPVVVLSNSLGADLSMWDAQVPSLLPDFRVLRYDTRGHGHSDVLTKSPGIDDLGRDVIALLNALDIDRAHLCGVSLGGMTAMSVALHAGDRLLSAVLSNTAAKIGTADSWNQRISHVQAHGLAYIADSVLARWFTPPYRARTPEFAQQRSMLLRCPAAGYIGACAAIRDMDLRTTIDSIRLPVLVISGSNDSVTPPADGLAIAAAIPGAQFAQVPGAHLSNIEEPAAYNSILLQFLHQL